MASGGITARRVITAALLVAGGSGAASALAQAGGRPALEADAFTSHSGPVVAFRAISATIRTPAPEVSAIRINRPSHVSVALPPASGSLGYLRFTVDGPSGPAVRRVGLRRRAALGDGRYTLANSAGARVVLSTRTTTSFLRVNLPPGSRAVTLSLAGRGARLLRVRGACTTQTFTAGFSLPSERTVLHRDTIVPKRLRAAGLCR